MRCIKLRQTKQTDVTIYTEDSNERAWNNSRYGRASTMLAVGHYDLLPMLTSFFFFSALNL